MGRWIRDILHRLKYEWRAILVSSAVVLVILLILEHTVTDKNLDALKHQQAAAIAAVGAINPDQIAGRYICALQQSVADTNRKMAALNKDPRYPGLGQRPVREDCMYTLSEAPHAPGALPAPVVGHWGDGQNAFTLFIAALFDTVWHLVVQPSWLASIFSIAVFVAGFTVAGVLMGQASITWHPYLGGIAFAVLAVIASSAIGWLLREVMLGALYLFQGIFTLAGLWIGATGPIAVAVRYVTMLFETVLHVGVESVHPH